MRAAPDVTRRVAYIPILTDSALDTLRASEPVSAEFERGFRAAMDLVHKYLKGEHDE